MQVVDDELEPDWQQTYPCLELLNSPKFFFSSSTPKCKNCLLPFYFH